MMKHFLNIQKVIVRPCFCLLVVLGLGLFASPVAGQVFDSGPSDSALFDSVISLPPGPDIGGFEGIGGDGGTTQLNVFDGGFVAGEFGARDGAEVNINGGSIFNGLEAFFGSEVNVSDGSLGGFATASSGSVVNVSGGSVGISFEAGPRSEVNITGGTISQAFDASADSAVSISGGTVGHQFRAFPNSNVELIGGDFQLNGTAFLGPLITTNAGDVLTGTLADGSTFIFADKGFGVRAVSLPLREGDRLSNVRLTSVAIPALDLSPEVVSTANPIRPSGLRAGQTLTLVEGGELGANFEAVGATLNVEGGVLGISLLGGIGAANSTVNISGGLVGDGFCASNSEVNISGGSVGCSFNANSGSEVNISGGSVGFGFDAFPGSLVNISGGSVGDNFDADSGSVVNISGGSVGNRFEAKSGAEVNISGGAIAPDFVAEAGSDVELTGGEFQLNGVAFTGTEISLNDGDVFSGTLTDGSSFIFFDDGGFLADFSNVVLTTGMLPTLDLQPVVVSTANPNRPSGLRAGQTLTLQDGGELGPNFAVVGATLNVEGGRVGGSAGAINGVVNISGGSVGSGPISDGLSAYAGSEINISGGSVENFFIANSGSEVNLSGGSLGFGTNFSAGSELNLFGSNFVLDGISLDGSLTVGEAFTIDDRDVVLSGLFPDGTAFSFVLSSEVPFNLSISDVFPTAIFSPDATLTVTLGAPVSTTVLGDINQDGAVNFQDIGPFIGALSPASPFIPEADCNQDGEVNFFDIFSFTELLSSN